jgi:hypothetical protein
LTVRSNGTVWAWGDNFYGELGNGTTSGSTVPVQVNGLSNVIAIAGGYLHSLAVRSNGTVWAWGRNEHGELGNGTSDLDSVVPVQVSGLSNVAAVAAGYAYSVALRSDGTVWAWGYNADGELGNGMTTDSPAPVQISGLSNVVAVASGTYHSLAIGSDGTA